MRVRVEGKTQLIFRRKYTAAEPTLLSTLRITTMFRNYASLRNNRERSREPKSVEHQNYIGPHTTLLWPEY